MVLPTITLKAPNGLPIKLPIKETVAVIKPTINARAKVFNQRLLTSLLLLERLSNTPVSSITMTGMTR